MLPEHYEHAALTVLLWVVNSQIHIPGNFKMKDSSVFSSKSQTAAYPNEVEFNA